MADIWVLAGVLGLGPAALGLDAARTQSRGAARAFGVWCLLVALPSFLLVFAPSFPRWPYAGYVLPALSLWCGVLGIVAAEFLPPRPKSGGHARTTT